VRTRLTAATLIAIAAQAILGTVVSAQQDKHALKLGNLAFSAFRGYENWKVVAVSHNDDLMKVIVANDVMIKAYWRGPPAEDQIFPEGSKVVKLEWSIKKNTVPQLVEVPDVLQAVANIEKDSKQFAGTYGWAYGNFRFDATSHTFTPQDTDARSGNACHSAAASKDYIFTA
jgi:hypothetical protein